MLPLRASLRFAALAALALTALVLPRPAPAAAAVAQSPALIETRLVDLANASRAERGLGPMRVDVRMIPDARAWSYGMAQRGQIGHEPNLRSHVPRQASATSENVGMSNAEDAASHLHQMLMGSAPHREAVLDGRWTDVAVGVVVSGGRAWMTQRFTAGAPAAVHWGVPATAAAARRDFVGHGASLAVVVRDDAFPDALAAGPLAGDRGPLLFTPHGEVPHPAVRLALEETLQPGATIYVVGGHAAVSQGVEDELRGAGWEVERLDGGDRFATSAAVARAVVERTGRHDLAMLASGEDWPDAAAAGAFGAQSGVPVLLTEHGAVPAPTAIVLDDLDFDRIVALGGSAALTDGVVLGAGAERIAGPDRMATSGSVARILWGVWEAGDVRGWTLVPAGGDGWLYALGAAPGAARRDTPVLLVGDPLSDGIRDYLSGLEHGQTGVPISTHGPVPAAAVEAVRALAG